MENEREPEREGAQGLLTAHAGLEPWELKIIKGEERDRPFVSGFTAKEYTQDPNLIFETSLVY